MSYSTGPTTRSQTRAALASGDRSKTPEPEELLPARPKFTEELRSALADLGDMEAVHGREARELRDATATAVTEAWRDARYSTSSLAKQISANNVSLLNELNTSFDRFQSLPTVVSCTPEGTLPKLSFFSGDGEAPQFSIWLRRFEDVLRMRTAPLTSEQKANFLIGHLEGVAREKIEELSSAQRKDFDAIVAHLRSFFESPQQRHIARQALSTCQQGLAESSTSFANRLLHLVRAATAGQDQAAQNERMLEEYVARLRGDIRYFVRLDNPVTFEQAVTRAQMIEQLLAEAASDKLMHPASHLGTPIQALAAQVERMGIGQRQNARRIPNPPAQRRFRPRRTQGTRADSGNPSGRFGGSNTCFNCGGRGHFSRQCPSPHPQARRNTSNTVQPQVSSTNPYVMTFQRSGAAADPQANTNRPDHALARDCPEHQLNAEMSQAQVAALLKRNHELSQSAFYGKHSQHASSSSSSSFPSTSVSCLFLTLLTVSFLMTVDASSAFLCPHNSHDQLLRIPFTYNCSNIMPPPEADIAPLSLSIFRPNTRRYSSSAFWCKIVTVSASFSVNFFGSRSITRTEKMQTVTLEQCRMMATHQRCEHGNLVQVGNSWRTSHELVVEWPSAPFGCCTQHTVSVTNCLMFPTTIYAKHGDDHPDALVGDLTTCKYRDGSCTLRDGSALIWSPNIEETCQFIPVGKMQGHRLGSIWLSDSREFALSWTETSDPVYDCGKLLQLTDQGYAIVQVRRSTRSSSAMVGMVTTNQLSAQLLAVEGSTKVSLVTLFRHALSSLCDRVNLLGLAIHTALSSQPTATVRHLLARRDIAATYLGNGITQIHKCLPVPVTGWRFVAFNSTCYSRPQVVVSLPSGISLPAFFDVDTGVITEHADEVPCHTVPYFYISDGSRVLRVDSFSGVISPVPARTIRDFTTLTAPSWGNATFPLTIFHNLVITNLSEIADGPRLQDFGAALEQHRVEEHVRELHDKRVALMNTQGFTPISVWSFLGTWTPLDVWLLFCGGVVSLQVLRCLLIIYITKELPELLPPIPRRQMAPSVPLDTTQYTQYTTPNPGSPRAPPCDPVAPRLSRVVIDAESTWPPRAVLAPTQVLALNTNPFFIAQVPIVVNEVAMLALIDTGAAITVSSRDITDLIGVFRLQPPAVRSAIGMAGIPVPLVGMATLRIQVGSTSLAHRVYFTKHACIPRQVDKYNIILGNDLLSRLPPWRINYPQRRFTVGKDTLPILTLTPMLADPPNMPSPQEEVKVRVVETSVIPAGSEAFVPCYTTCHSATALMLVTQPPMLYNRHLSIAPAVLNSGQTSILITNSSSQPQAVYSNQHIATAVPLATDTSGRLSEVSLDATCLETNASRVAAVTDRETSDVRRTLNIDLSHSELTEPQKAQLHDLFSEYQDRISQSSYDLGSYTHTLVHIKTTTESPPMRFRPPRIPVKFQKELDEHINKLLKSGRIVESDTPWVHNTVLVKKRDGSLRVCLDFRPLNEVTIPDHYPLPRIEDLLSKVAGNRYYTTLDLASGYMQLLMSPESQEKCGWATHRGIYQFVYLPFGLRNAGAYFCRAMSRILSGLDDSCLAYIDDIIIFNKTFDDHLQTLRSVFERFRLFNIKTSGKKLTDIARSRVTFLGHEVSFTSYSPADHNLKAIREFPSPTCVKEVKRFLGMANFFRRFIRNFATIAAPLYELTKESAKFVWGARQEEAFQTLRDCLTSKPCLAYPRDREFILCTDGSSIAVGAGLFQKAADDSSKLVAIGYYSKALSESQRRWSPTHIELFAMISALRFFRATIYGNLTRIFSDHKPLTFLLKHNKIHDNLARWIVELQSYNVTIEYLKGSSNTVADCLSRVFLPSSQFQDNSPESDDIIEFPRCLVGSLGSRDEVPPLLQQSPIAIKPHDLLIEQQADRLCRDITHFLRHGTFREDVSDEQKPYLLQIADHCLLKPNGCLYYRHAPPSTPGKAQDQIVVPDTLKEALFLAFHESPSAGGHFFWRKTLAKISRKYYWPHMAEDVYTLCRSCDVCQRKRAAARNREELLPPVPVAIFDKVYVDLTGPMHITEAGNRYIIAMVDHFSKYVIAVALPDCSAATVARALMNECVLKYGVMTELISDNASYFRSEVLTELGKLLRIHRYFCTPYHHEGNGACERVFATFQLMLRSYINAAQSDWDQFVPACTFMYNTSTHSSTQNTPFFLMFGRDPTFNVDLLIRHHEERHVPADYSHNAYVERLLPVLHAAWKDAFMFNAKQRETYKTQYDKTHLRPLDVRVGDRVYLRNLVPTPGLSSKLCMPWLGQFRVIAVKHPHVVIVSISSPGSSPKQVHMNQVKKCHLLSGPVFTSPWLPKPEQAALINCQAEDYSIPGYSRSVTLSDDAIKTTPTHTYNTRLRKRLNSL